MGSWIFQCNPDNYRIVDAIRELKEMKWPVTRYAAEIAIGDNVGIWIAKGVHRWPAGVYCLGEITTAPAIPDSPPNGEYRKQGRSFGTQPHVMVLFREKLLTTPILLDKIKSDATLQRLVIVRSPTGTNYRVTSEQWRRICDLVKKA